MCLTYEMSSRFDLYFDKVLQMSFCIYFHVYVPYIYCIIYSFVWTIILEYRILRMSICHDGDQWNTM